MSTGVRFLSYMESFFCLSETCSHLHNESTGVSILFFVFELEPFRCKNGLSHMFRISNDGPDRYYTVWSYDSYTCRTMTECAVGENRSLAVMKMYHGMQKVYCWCKIVIQV